MSYEYTFEDNCLAVEPSITKSNYIYVGGDALIPNEDAPRVALEILKAAGFDTSTENTGVAMAFTYLNDAVGLMDIHKKADALNKRRDELAREFGYTYGVASLTPSAPIRRAIDRIIELESKP